MPWEGEALLLEAVVDESQILPPGGLGLWLLFGAVQLERSLGLYCTFRWRLFFNIFQFFFFSAMDFPASLAEYVFSDSSDDVLDVSVLEHHLLMVAVALCGGSGADCPADEHIDLDVFSLLGSQTEELLVVPEEDYVFLLFCLGPGEVRLSCPRFLALYYRQNGLFLVGWSYFYE